MCKVLTNSLKPLDEKAESFLKNSKQLKEELEKLEIDDNHIMGSLDIRQMYPMIPVEKTLKVTNLSKTILFETERNGSLNTSLNF